MNDLVAYDPHLALGEISFEDAASLSLYLDAKCREREMVGGRWTLVTLPTREDRDRMERRKRELHRALQPISGTATERERAQQVIAQVLLGYPEVTRKTQAEQLKLANTYVLLLNELPIFAIERVCDDWRRGLIPSVDYSFVPPAPLLAQLAERVKQPFAMDLARIRLVMDVREERYIEPPKRTAEEQAAINETVSSTLRAMNERAAAQQKVEADAEALRKSVADTRRERVVAQAWEKFGHAPIKDPRTGLLLWPAQVMAMDTRTLERTGIAATPELLRVLEAQRKESERRLRGHGVEHQDQGS